MAWHCAATTDSHPTGLPDASAETRAFFGAWLETFASHVRDVDYAAARPLFHPDVLAFGTHRDVIPGIEAWITAQWDNVWPKTDDFRFDLGATRVLAAVDMAVVQPIATIMVKAGPKMPCRHCAGNVEIAVEIPSRVEQPVGRTRSGVVEPSGIEPLTS